jgi:hypothetical protein
MPIPAGSGDQGQRYAVEVFVDEEEAPWQPGWHFMAYANVLESVQAIAQGFVLRPNWSRTRVIDRKDPSGKSKIVNYYQKK